MQCTFPSVYTHPKQRHSQSALLQTSRAQGEMSCEQMCERREGGWFFVHERGHTQDRAKAACRFENSVTKRGWALRDFLSLLFRRVLKWARHVAWWHSCISDMCKYVWRHRTSTAKWQRWQGTLPRCGKAPPQAATDVNILLALHESSFLVNICCIIWLRLTPKHILVYANISEILVEFFFCQSRLSWLLFELKFSKQKLPEGPICKFQIFSWVGQESF